MRPYYRHSSQLQLKKVKLDRTYDSFIPLLMEFMTIGFDVSHTPDKTSNFIIS